MYSYRADYLTLGTMVDWTAQVDDGDGDLPSIGGSIRLSRGQTQGLAPTLVMHMIGQTIDAMQNRAVMPA
ncbi:hypothetical protein [Aquabacterium sp.]|uniref:hypothetical protein n=1 Tax=Aquabacterium sp. TaxID=1872578 RepID=UPI002CAC0D45|nr:hypothetical protein [Aquabacterium sp.]HSW05939.1 hypothetical protein [Aquabacterium sp.]